MLRFKPYVGSEKEFEKTFPIVFDKSEIEYLQATTVSDYSYVGVDRTGAVQAFIIVQETPEGHAEYEISFLGVMPRYRKKGHAKRLLEIALSALRDRTVWLQVLKQNVAACRLYSSVGFDKSEEFMTAIGETGVIWMHGVRYECETCPTILVPSETTWVQLKPFCSTCADRDA
jgi:ribosomal protein S18 acetylase RimI-like enzyme